MLGKEVLILWSLLCITICSARPNKFDLQTENKNIEKVGNRIFFLHYSKLCIFQYLTSWQIEVNADVNVWLNDYLLHQIEICNFYKDLLEKRGDKLARKKNRDRIQILGRVIKKRTDQKIKMKNTVSKNI